VVLSGFSAEHANPTGAARRFSLRPPAPGRPVHHPPGQPQAKGHASIATLRYRPAVRDILGFLTADDTEP
jgi:hypothetical protein